MDKIDEPVNAIFWIMKDPTIPPVVKLKGASLASVMGATLATKTIFRRESGTRRRSQHAGCMFLMQTRSGPILWQTTIEKFKKLVEEKNVDCYIVNTGDFMGKKVQPKDTLGILEAIVEGKAEFKPWGPFTDIEIFDWEGFVPDMNDADYVAQLKARMNDRLAFD